MDRCDRGIIALHDRQGVDWGVSRQVHRGVRVWGGGIARCSPRVGLLLGADSTFGRGGHARLRQQIRITSQASRFNEGQIATILNRAVLE